MKLAALSLLALVAWLIGAGCKREPDPLAPPEERLLVVAQEQQASCEARLNGYESLLQDIH